MRAFTFYMHDGRRGAPDFQIGEFKDERAAYAYARDLLDEQPQLISVDVYNGVDEPISTERDRRAA